MRKKNLFLALLAMVLVCAISVTGTMAYLTMTTVEKPVINTFMASGGGKLAESITLLEHVVADEKDGVKDGIYELTTATTENNSYNVLPGTDLPKDPYITIVDKTTAPAYLYVDVVGKADLASVGLTFELDDCWKEIEVNGAANKGTVYVYCNATTKEPVVLNDSGADLSGINIIKDKVIKVDSTNENVKLTDEKELTFYAYLAQASVSFTEGDKTETSSEPDEVFETCFSASTNP